MTEHSTDPSPLKFNPKDHTYTVDGKIFPSVTQILETVGYTNYTGPWFTEKARDLGSNLHACCALVDEDDLDWDSVDESIRPEVEAYAEWKTKTGFVANLIEKPMYSVPHGIAGTPDVFGSFPSGQWVLLDRKRGKAGKATRFQTAMYVLLVCEYYTNQAFIGTMYPFQISRFALDGFSSGMPKMVAYEDRTDLHVANGVIAAYHGGVNAGIY